MNKVCPACDGEKFVGRGYKNPLTLSYKHYGKMTAECETCNGTGVLPERVIDVTSPGATKGVAGTITNLMFFGEQVPAAEFAESLGLPEGTEAWVEKHEATFSGDAVIVQDGPTIECVKLPMPFRNP